MQIILMGTLQKELNVPLPNNVHTQQQYPSNRNGGLYYRSSFNVNSRANPYNGFRSAARTANSSSHPACTSGCFRSERQDGGYPTRAKWWKSAGNEPAGSVCGKVGRFSTYDKPKTRGWIPAKGVMPLLLRQVGGPSTDGGPYSDFWTAGHQPLSKTVTVMKSKIHYRLNFNQGCVTVHRWWFKKDKQCMYKRNTEVLSRNNWCRGKAISITYSECVFVALGPQRAKCMLRITLTSVTCPALPHFSTLSHKRNNYLKKKVIEHKICILIFSTSFVWNISHSKKNSVRYHKLT